MDSRQFGICVIWCKIPKMEIDLPEEPKFVTYAKQDRVTGTKRTSGEIRESTLSTGAVLLKFDQPPDTPKEYVEQWRTLEDKGFHVTDDGCIFPYKYYWSSFGKGHKNKGHQRSYAFFYQRRLDNQLKVTKLGWPATEQISHLCHRENCVNPLHLVVEAQWCNQRRNFCGLGGQCTCGMKPPCLHTYKNWVYFLDDVCEEAVELVCTEREVLDALSELSTTFSFRVLKKTSYAKEDQKAQARKKRKASARKSSPKGSISKHKSSKSEAPVSDD